MPMPLSGMGIICHLGKGRSPCVSVVQAGRAQEHLQVPEQRRAGVDPQVHRQAHDLHPGVALQVQPDLGLAAVGPQHVSELGHDGFGRLVG